ncbi:MAG: DUF177 domain-containing protein [Geminicoccaceae bacterium]
MGAVEGNVVAEREFSREIDIARIPSAGRPFAIAAEPAELAALARRLRVQRIDRLEARGTVTGDPSEGLVTVEGHFEAEVTQLCVVTLEPVATRVEGSLRRLFQPGVPSTTREVVVDPLAEEPEPLAGDRLDLGEIVAEELALALDPYPRLPGATLEVEPPEADGEDREPGRIGSHGPGGRA